jgi:PmbA protein
VKARAGNVSTTRGSIGAERGNARLDVPGGLPGEALLDLGARAVERAIAAGASQAEACVDSTRAFRASVSGGAIETLKHSATRGLGLRVVVGDAIGFVTTTDVRAETLDDLARRAVALAKFSTPDPCNLFVSPAEAEDANAAADTEDLELFDPAVLAIDTETKIEWALELERVALAYDKRITRTDGASVSMFDGASAIVNSNGIARTSGGSSISAYVVPLAEDRDGKQQTGYYGVSKRWLGDLPEFSAIATEAARRAVSRVGARSVPSARVPVILHPDIAANWIAEMHEAFSGEALIKESSWLSGRLDQMIAASRVTLVDDGRLKRGMGSDRWDGEGVATRRNVLIDRGRLATFVYDVYHARRAKRASTGSAVRSYSSSPSIGYANLYVERGDQTPEQILKSIDRGFYMDDQGSFGFNSVTGDYSYQAQGFWIEKGEKAFPVEGITVASNSIEMLKNVAAIGNDLRFDHAVASPTLLIGEMTVSGAAG